MSYTHHTPHSVVNTEVLLWTSLDDCTNSSLQVLYQASLVDSNVPWTGEPLTSQPSAHCSLTLCCRPYWLQVKQNAQGKRHDSHRKIYLDFDPDVENPVLAMNCSRFLCLLPTNRITMESATRTGVHDIWSSDNLVTERAIDGLDC